jgi:hypothetical protein
MMFEDDDIAKIAKLAGVRLETAVLSPNTRQKVVEEALQWNLAGLNGNNKNPTAVDKEPVLQLYA